MKFEIRKNSLSKVIVSHFKCDKSVKNKLLLFVSLKFDFILAEKNKTEDCVQKRENMCDSLMVIAANNTPIYQGKTYYRYVDKKI